MHVAKVEISRIDESMTAFFSTHFKPPERRFCKSIFHRAAFVHIATVGAVTFI